MSSSPAHAISVVGHPSDVFERLARCDRLLTAKELGEILAISPKTLYNYVTRGMIPFFKIESNVRFRARDVADWLRKRSG
jgi:excisionase family DNA binding protein